ncbi:hypothetical protein GCM10028806_13830 [Spirosoma terrae]|uniref:Uncharacterized protein n=1 Tax=Spirosoma terrae TaxID=1968276 RepID=A0A6L9L9H9_9BACT|nr:hypothetical protein [Spirosoma terrae]NDU95038.1 hypothetical protein [Spirosoma terrae]
MLSQDYSFSGQQGDSTIVGVGSTGIAAVEYLHQTGVKGVNMIVCGTDSDEIRASRVPYKILFLPEELESGNSLGVASLQTVLTEQEPVLIVADLSDSNTASLVLLIAQYVQEGGQTCIAIVVSEPGQNDTFLERLQAYAHGLMVVLPTEDEPQETVNRLVHTANALIDMIQAFGGVISVDYADVKHILKGRGRAVITSGEAEGEQRAADVIKKAIETIEGFSFDWQQAQRVLAVMAYGGAKPATMREQLIINEGINSRMGRDAAMFKMGYIQDDWLGETLKLVIMLWMPV